jgi:hypothetical protein
VAVLIVFALCYRRYDEPRVHWLMLLWIAPAPIAFVISQWLPQSIWGHRHLLFAIWPFFLLFADAIWRMPRVISYTVMTMAGIWGVYAMAFHARDNRKLPWDALTLAVLDAEHTSAPQVPIFAIDPYLHYPIQFYLDCLKTGQDGPVGPRLSARSDQAELAVKAGRFQALKADSVSEAQGTYFWVAWTDSSWHEPSTPPQMLERRGCRAGAEISQRDNYHTVTMAPITCP